MPFSPCECCHQFFDQLKPGRDQLPVVDGRIPLRHEEGVEDRHLQVVAEQAVQEVDGRGQQLGDRVQKFSPDVRVLDLHQEVLQVHVGLLVDHLHDLSDVLGLHLLI